MLTADRFSWVLVHRASLGLVLNAIVKKKLNLNFCSLVDQTKSQSRSKRRFCGFRFLTSQLLAVKRVIQLLFLQINYIFVTLEKVRPHQNECFIATERMEKRWRDECRGPNWKGGVVQEGMDAGLLLQFLFSVCAPACIRGAGMWMCNPLIWDDNMNTCLHNKK